MDSFGASEGLGYGLSVTTAQGGTAAKFGIGEFCDVFDEMTGRSRRGAACQPVPARAQSPQDYKDRKSRPRLRDDRWCVTPSRATGAGWDPMEA